MGIPKTITVQKEEYYYWDEYESGEECKFYADKIKYERRLEGIKLKYFILESKDSWFLPVPKWVLYFNRKMRLT